MNLFLSDLAVNGMDKKNRIIISDSFGIIYLLFVLFSMFMILIVNHSQLIQFEIINRSINLLLDFQPVC